jgi:hypothetical protein
MKQATVAAAAPNRACMCTNIQHHYTAEHMSSSDDT